MVTIWLYIFALLVKYTIQIIQVNALKRLFKLSSVLNSTLTKSLIDSMTAVSTVCNLFIIYICLVIIPCNTIIWILHSQQVGCFYMISFAISLKYKNVFLNNWFVWQEVSKTRDCQVYSVFTKLFCACATLFYFFFKFQIFHTIMTDWKI